MLGKLFMMTVFVATPAVAQRGGGGGGGEEGAAAAPMMRPQPRSKADLFVDHLKMNKDQKVQTQVILNDAFKEVSPLRVQLERTRAQIAEAILNNKSPEDVRKLTDVHAATAAQITNIEADAFAKVCALLKPNQQSRAATAFDLLTAVLDPPGNAGAGAGGRRGRN